MTKITVTSTCAETLQLKVSKRLAAMKGGAARSILVQFGAAIVDEYKRVQRTFTPGDVPDLTDAYKKVKARKHGSIYPILTATGEMMNSMHAVVRVRSREGLYSIRIAFHGERNQRLAEIHTREAKKIRNFMRGLPPRFVAMWNRKILAATKGK